MKKEEFDELKERLIVLSEDVELKADIESAIEEDKELGGIISHMSEEVLMNLTADLEKDGFDVLGEALDCVWDRIKKTEGREGVVGPKI